jgi:hypothetical protein
MQRKTLHKGLVIKLLTDYSNVPAGTWATVDSTGTMRDGAWWFTVQWHPYSPIRERFPHAVIEYSLNLWESDLALFELVSDEEQQEANKRRLNVPSSSVLAPLPQSGERWQAKRLGRRAHVQSNQLSLFVADDF